jgi:hypothetical protein
MLTTVSLLLVGVCAYLAAVSYVSNYRSQSLAYDALRIELARGTAPVGPSFVPTAQADPGTAETAIAPPDDAQQPEPQLLAAGTPVALLSIPRIGLDQEVVLEGSTSEVLQDGLGHDRLTALPGQPGWVQVLGRRWTYGGPFRDLARVRPGDQVLVVTGQGRHRYEVTGLRGPRTPAPVLPPGQGRLVLVTASGPPFVASGTVYVDAILRSPPVAGPASQVLPVEPAALPLAGDSSAWLVVLLWCQALLVTAVAFGWARSHWGRAQAWFVAVPTFALVVAGLAGAFGRLLPNLL